MKHFIVFFQIISFFTGFLSIMAGLLIYERYKNIKLKYYILFLTSLTLILLERIVTVYEIINFIDIGTLSLILQTISALGCILMVYALPRLVLALFELNVSGHIKNILLCLTAALVLALLLYYTAPFKMAVLIASNSILFLTVFVSLVYSTANLKKIKAPEIRLVYGRLLLITFIAFPFMYIDSRYGGSEQLLKHFPYGLLSVAIYYFIWNLLFLYYAYKYYIKFTGSINAAYIQSDAIKIPKPNEDFYERFKITGREKEVILLIKQGKSYNDISEELNISLPTVKTHIYNIYQKTGVNNKIALINLLSRE